MTVLGLIMHQKHLAVGSAGSSGLLTGNIARCYRRLDATVTQLAKLQSPRGHGLLFSF